MGMGMNFMGMGWGWGCSQWGWIGDGEILWRWGGGAVHYRVTL